MHNIYIFECPEQVETRRLFVLVLDPATALECTLDVAVAAPDDEDFCVGVDSILLLPLLHVCDIELGHSHHLLVAL